MINQPTYLSGQPIHVGDRVKYEEREGEIELVITEQSPGWELYWHELGPGVMVKRPECGRVYVPFDDKGLEFVARTAMKQ